MKTKIEEIHSGKVEEIISKMNIVEKFSQKKYKYIEGAHRATSIFNTGVNIFIILA